MFSSKPEPTTQDPSTPTTSYTQTTDSDRRGNTSTTNAPTSTTTSSHQQHETTQHQQQPSYGTTSAASSSRPQSSQQQQQQRKPQPTRGAEPYATQESTWWEESPHPSRTEQGYGPGPSSQPHRHQGASAGPTGPRGNMYGGGQSGHTMPFDDRERGDHKRDDQQGVVNWNKVAKIICAVLLPPLGVFLETGCDKSFAINLLLTILGYIPGIIHAIYVITTD